MSLVDRSGAINPSIIRDECDTDSAMMAGVPVHGAFEHIVDYTGVRATGPGETADFIVRALPPSLKSQILDFDTLSSSQESQFLATLAKDIGFDVPHRNQRCERALLKIVEDSQSFVRRQRLWRVHPSIRDMIRVLQLYRTLLTKSDVFLPPLPSGIALATEAASDFVHWSAVVVSVAMAYMMRLPAVLRVEWSRCIDVLLVQNGCPRDVNVSIVQTCIDQLYAGTLVPRGIAPTRCVSKRGSTFCFLAHQLTN